VLVLEWPLKRLTGIFSQCYSSKIKSVTKQLGKI
jgi:hypothetical protein